MLHVKSPKWIQSTLLKERKKHGLGRMSMTAEQYRLARSMRGTQKDVAAYLKVARVTIARRESGRIKIPHEATLALLTMPAINNATKAPPAEQSSFEGVTP